MSTVITPSSCLDLTEAGCMDIEEKWEWGWDATRVMRKRPNDSISNVAWTVPAELTQGTPIVAGNVFYVPISNSTGVAGDTFQIIAKVTTVLGAIMRLRINLTLTDVTA